MIEILSAKVERWKVDGAFIISRGAKIDVDVVVCEVTDGTHVGRGEGTPIYYEGETADLCADSILMRGKQRRKITREDLLDSMMEGAARNALDCALWDLEAKQAGKAVRSEEHTSELQSLMRISYAVFCLKKKKQIDQNKNKILTET